MAITISTGESYTLDGVTYTATQDAVLNLDDDNKVSGLASGSVTAVVSGAKSSPTITFDATDGAINFTATSDGKIITSKMVLPLEIISGEFTFNGSTLGISAGSKLAIVTTNGDYSLRNENTFVYDSNYTFSGASMTSNSERVISHFVLSDGTNTRELNLEQLGTVINNFSERGFTLVKGSSEVMNIGDYSITATAVDNDAGLNISLGKDGITLVPNSGDGALNVALSRNGQEIFAGELECTSGTITFGFDKAVTFSEGTSFDFKWNGYVSRVTTTATATTDIALTDSGLSFTPHDGDGALNIVLYKDGTQIFGGALNVTGGTISFDATEQKFSFTEGTKIALAIGTDGSQEMDIEIVGGDASFKVEADTSGNFNITPDTDDGSIDVTLKRDGETVFKNNVSVNGSIIINPVTNLLTLVDGTTVNVAFDNYTLTATAQGDAASTMSLTADGILITPNIGDGTLNLTLTGTSSGSLSANIEVLSGSFIFGNSGALTVTKGTELQIDFGDGYKVNFKATDDAGGAISLGSEGITFAPYSSDGSLELTITRDGQTRTSSLDVTGSVTYKLDGSISLAQGTVVRNVFDSNNILTITANTDASGTIIFNPQTGLDITPSTPDALSLLLSTESEDIIKIASVTGSVNYINRTFTASDGTAIRFVDPAGYYSDNVLRTAGGTTSLYFADYGISYTANEGATFTMDYLQGTTWELQQGTITDNFSGPTQGKMILSEGAIFDTNDYEFPFTLGAVGNYTLNGMNITTTSANNVQVQLANYDTIIVDGVSYKALDDATQFTFDSDGKISSIASGKVQATVAGAENSPTVTFDATDGATNFSATGDNTLDVTLAGRTFKFTEGTATISGDTINTGAAKFLMSGTHSQADYEFTVEDSSEISITTDYFSISAEKFSVAVSAGSITLNFDVSGTAIRNFTNHTFVLADGTTVSTTLGDYTISATTTDETGGELSFTSKGVTFSPNNNNNGSIGIDVLRGGTSIFSKGISLSISNGSISFNPFTQEISLAKDTVLTFVRDDGKSIEITALDEAGGQLTLTDDGIRFAPNSGDGALELNFVSTERKAVLNITGAVIFDDNGKVSLEDGTVVDITWEDGVNLKMTSHGSTGSIAFTEKGLQITSDDENLDITLTTAIGLQTNLSGIKGTIYYNAGTVSFDENATITATTTLGGQPILTTLETIDGTGHISFADNGVIYSADTGALRITWSRDKLESTFTVNSGTIQIGHNLFKLTEGTVLSTDLKNFVPALYTLTVSGAGSYTINGQTITTDGENISMRVTDDYTSFTPSDDVVTYNGMTFSGSGTVTVSSSGAVTCDATDGTLKVSVPLEEVIGKSVLLNTFDISGGTISFDDTNKKISCAAGTTLSFTQDEQTITLTTTKDISATYKVEEDIYYLMLDDSATANVTITRDGEKIVGGEMEMGGVYSYRPETGTFGLTGANSSHGDGTNTFFQFAIDGQKSTSRLETNDTTIVFIPTLTGDKYEINFPNERKHAMKLTITRDGQTIFENKIAIDGTVGLGTSTQELSLNKGTVLTLTQGENAIEITALEDAGGQLTFIDGGIRFAPNSGDGALELNFVTTERKANLNITGAIILGEDGKLSLEEGTEVNLDWEDGINLKLTSTGSTGSIGIGEKGLQIASEDENLSIELTTATGYKTTVSNIQGSLWYNAGNVIIEDGTSLTGTGTVGGQAVDVILEAQGGDGYLNFGATGMTYAAGTGALKVTLALGAAESTFVVNSGSVFIGNNIFRIAEDTDLATDLKDFVPALNFTTSDAGTYTINGQTITTSAANLALTATDNYMTFTTSDDVVTYDGMTFAGAGKVSLTPNSVVLGAGVEAEGFGKDKSFVLAEAGNVTADARIFELAEEVPTGLTVTGAQDGFIFSRTTTEESESRFSNPNPDNVGKIFTEKFIAAGDSSYRIQTDLLGLQQIIGISGDTTILGSASFDGEPEETVFDIVTNSEGVFTVGEKKYIISGDSSVAIMADFEPDKSYVRGFKDLSGIASGDFNDHAVTVNGGIPIVVKGGKIVDIVADENGQEVFGIRDGESLVASLAGSYTVDIRAIELIEDVPKGITIEGTAGGDFKIGSTSDSGKVLVENFSATGGDYAYSLQISTLGLEKVLGVSDGTTITGGADIDGEISDQDFDIITKTEGAFTFGKRTYSISGDSSVSIKAAFKLDEGYAYSFDGLSGTVSGNFNDGNFSVNGGESILISGDSSIGLVAGAKGIELFNVTGGVSLIEMGGVSKVHTDTEGIFTFGNGKDDTLAITIQGDDNVTFELNDAQFVTGINNVEGDIFFSETNASLSVNGISGTFSGEFSSIGAYSSALYIHDVTDDSGLVTSDEDKIWLQLRGGSFALNDNSLTLTNDADGIWLREKEIVGLAEGASLQVGEAGTYTVNETVLSAKADDIIVGLANNNAYIYDPNSPLITKNTPTDEIIQQITGGDSSINTVVASGRENLSLSGGDLVVVEDTSAKVSITASKGNDTIASKGGNVHIKLNSTGKTDLFALDGRITLEGYDAATGTGFGTNYSDIFSAIGDAIEFDSGRLSIDSAVVTFDKDSELINFYDAAGELQKVGYAAGDESLDTSKQTEDLILFAEKYSSITGGAGSDSIFAEAGSYIDAGAGKNYIEIEEERGTNDDGATIAIRSGKVTVDGFKAGFDDISDRVFFGVNDAVDFKFDGTDLKVYNNGELRGVLSKVADGADFVNILTADDNSAPKVAVAQEGAVITVEDEVADLYSGEKSGVDFTNCEENLSINLGSENSSVGGGEVLFIGINRVTLGGGQNTLISSSYNETLTGNGTTEFIFSKNSGRDVIQNFNFEGDKISVGNETITAVNVNSAGGVRMEISGSAVLTLNDAQGKNFKINEFTALVDKNLTYNDEANYFVATERNATLTVGDGAQIWLDGSHGKYFSGEIRTLDASTSTGKSELAGNDLDNKIFAGQGDASLWGGRSGDDLLVGGAGKNSFFYTGGNDDDTISGTNAGDLVYLSEITLDQISSTAVANNVATINFKDGGKLTINDASNASYILTQGVQAQIYKVNESGFVAK